ncbi:NAD-dependent epimerase/dehydratase family protein [bacterium]|nr:NAD-dependent epimerase/dehydratase family protein [bacterium]
MFAMYANKRILVTGATGLIGRALVKLLIQAGARVRAASLRDPIDPHPEAEYVQGDLMSRDVCAGMTRGMDYVFHLASIKGSVGVGRKYAADFFVKPILMNTHMMEESRKAGVEAYLFASSICVYAPARVFVEEKAWDAPPQQADAFAGWAKRMGEMQAAAYREQYGWNKIAIVRPVNIYGPYDNFDPQTAQVIPALIARVVHGENPLCVWGDGTAVRDFLYCRDAARGMMLALEKYANGSPVNLGSGVGFSVREIAEAILAATGRNPEIRWDTSKATGEKYRVADAKTAREHLGFQPEVSLRDGIAETVKWYMDHRDGRSFRKPNYSPSPS